MAPDTQTLTTLSPAEVHPSLGRHILVDGFRIVVDLERSHGTYLYDALGEREILDLFTSFSTCALGYNHPGMANREFEKRVLPAAINKPANSDLYTTAMAEFVTTFASTLPAALRGNLFFISGGALAVENALKTAFDWKRRKNLEAGRAARGDKIIHFRHAFHGRSGYTLSLTNTDPAKTDYFPKFDWPRVSTPQLRFPVTEAESERVAEAERRTLDEIERALKADPHSVAGLIIEPIQGEGGDNHFRGEFLTELRRLADEREFLLIFDEVQTGFATTGRWWCCEHFDVVPDVLAFGKKTQICGIAAGERVNEVDSVFRISSRINSTWGGNLVDMIRCHRIVEIVEQENLLESARRVGEGFLSGLQALEGEFPGRVTNSRGRGMFLAFDLPDTGLRNRVLKELLALDVLGLSSGERSIRFRPPVSLTVEEARLGLERLGAALGRALS